MAKTEVLQTRVPEELKKNAENVLNKLGLTTGQAINLFLNQVVLTQSVPLKLELPQYTKNDLDRMVDEAVLNMKNGSVPIDGDEFFKRLEAKYVGKI